MYSNQGYDHIAEWCYGNYRFVNEGNEVDLEFKMIPDDMKYNSMSQTYNDFLHKLRFCLPFLLYFCMHDMSYNP